MNSKIAAHVAQSGLIPSDLRARKVGQSELAACRIENSNIDGYVIPYFDINGKPISFYRLRLFNYISKYRQPRKTINHVYYPPNFMNCFKSNGSPYVIITEGERKAAAAVKAGIPAIGFGGVDNWRSRTLILPDKTKFESSTHGPRKIIIARIPPNNDDIFIKSDVYANGFQEFLDFVLRYKLIICIVFDSDLSIKPLVKFEVQRAANTLGHELVDKDIAFTNIKQVILPNPQDKMGLDDFLMHKDYGKNALLELIQQTCDQTNAFPKHPTPKQLINDRLNSGNINRKSMIKLARNLLVEIDSEGNRLIDKNTRMPYYFYEQTKTLMQARLLSKNSDVLHETPFGMHIHRKYGIDAPDVQFLGRFAALYTAEEPIKQVVPARVLTITKDNDIALQLSDSQFAIISNNPKKPLSICSNGYKGILFEQNQVNPVNIKLLVKEFQYYMKQPLKPLWRNVLESVHIQGNHNKEIATLLYYLSPWLRRWNGIQLPIEIVCGEAGSGKSSLYALRLSILTGRPLLRNVPQDLRDWHASITSTGGLHVTDNVQFTNKDIRQKLSDEICRIITEPEPHIEMRKLYTTASQISLPVTTTFAFTSIEQPFHNIDILQRAAIFNIDAIKSGSMQGNWLESQLTYGRGREGWLAHHLVIIHKFLKQAKLCWSPAFAAKHRLAHYEQAMGILGDLLGIETDWLGSMLQNKIESAITESDWTLQGLKEFIIYTMNINHKEFTTQDIATWAQMEDDYQANGLLTSPRRLGRYLKSHKNTLLRTCNLTSLVGKRGNRVIYGIIHQK